MSHQIRWNLWDRFSNVILKERVWIFSPIYIQQIADSDDGIGRDMLRWDILWCLFYISFVFWHRDWDHGGRQGEWHWLWKHISLVPTRHWTLYIHNPHCSEARLTSSLVTSRRTTFIIDILYEGNRKNNWLYQDCGKFWEQHVSAFIHSKLQLSPNNISPVSFLLWKMFMYIFNFLCHTWKHVSWKESFHC